GKGIFGRKGFAVLDDSAGPVLEDGEFLLRDHPETDLYFFGYGRDFYGGLRGFCALCGHTPMIPRYALGNWWSRYCRYSETSYLELLERFQKERIPLSVAVIDMDWHLTRVDPKYGNGWTGYTWNEELFPDYRRFLRALKDRKLAVTLNLHPADGIRGFEEAYARMARALGRNPETEDPLEFDFGDPAWRRAYFEQVLHPYEQDGVDFWWIDWQQGEGEKDEVDPLLLLNHYHYLDLKEQGRRPMTFSRYAGVGSHRYPVGFSGDTHTTWKSLAFQPVFTSTAANIGYGWWSHDIGGHMLGDKDLDRLVRWIQFGVFSPVMRIHSSSSPFFNKEPWMLPEPYRGIVGRFMRLRHALVPYLYTENRRASVEDRPLIRPMYYDLPEDPESYEVGNEYRFGENLIVCAVTEKTDPKLRMGYSRGLIPEGRWYDIFSGRIYEGRKVRKLYRTLEEIPVLLPAGGIVPLAQCGAENGTENPASLRILVGAGADGSYELYEDDGESMAYETGGFVTTGMHVRYDGAAKELTFTAEPAVGDLELIPEKRKITLDILGCTFEKAVLRAGEVQEALPASGGAGACKEGDIQERWGTEGRAVLELPALDPSRGYTVTLTGVRLLQNDTERLVFAVLDGAWIANLQKDIVFDKYRTLPLSDFRQWLQNCELPEQVKDALEEVL
ncbi:MAG: DUF5110 domain-containing protein, partial [Lachnospiraceae bacterium]|nr:DUF5110 domain-containing protein [Lachnospiraceae bacterium]